MKTTVQDAPHPPDLQRFRGYLHLLAATQLHLRAQGRFDASDIVQQTLQDAHRDWPQFQGNGEPELQAWLRKVLANNLLAAIRHSRAKRDVRREVAIMASLDQSSACLEQFLAGDQTSPSQCAQRNERYEQLMLALNELSDDQRQAVVLKHLQGKPLTEVAELLGRSIAATGGLLKRGMTHLRQLLAEGPEKRLR